MNGTDGPYSDKMPKVEVDESKSPKAPKGSGKEIKGKADKAAKKK